MPVVYKVPAEIKQPPTLDSRNPEPEKLPVLPPPPPPPPDPDLGRYLIPVLGQVLVVPLGAALTKVPNWTLPVT